MRDPFRIDVPGTRAHVATLVNDPHSTGIRFRMDRPTYGQMATFARDQRDLFDPQEEGIPCFCGD